MLAMLRHVAEVALAAKVGPVALATSEPSAPDIAKELGIGTASDGGLPWNEGLTYALAQIEPPPQAVLYLAGDLPLLRSDEVRYLVAEAENEGVTIGRAHDGGTNALVLRPPDAIVPAFGSPDSALVHQHLADRHGLRTRVVDLPGVAFDVDTPEDAARASR